MLIQRRLCVRTADDADDSIELPVISASAAAESLEILRTFLLQQEGASEHLKLLGKYDQLIREKRAMGMRQSTIDQFFERQ